MLLAVIVESLKSIVKVVKTSCVSQLATSKVKVSSSLTPPHSPSSMLENIIYLNVTKLQHINSA